MYKLKILPKAQKDIDELHGKIFSSIKDKILSLVDNPRPYGTIKLTGENGYRIRVQDYRILYRIDDRLKEVFIYRIKLRKDAYR